MDSFFGLDTPTKGDKDTALLTTTHDSVEREIICSILTAENIPYRVVERGSGAMVKMLAGYSMFGSDIFVPTALLEQASALLDAFRNGEIVEEEVESVDEV